MDHLAPDGKIQLARGSQIRADQLQIGQLNDAIVALRIEKVHQRSSAMEVGVGNRVPHARRLISIFLFVWPEQRDITSHLFIGRIDIAENLRPRGISQLLAAIDIDQRPLLLALVAVEDPQGYVEAEAEGIVVYADVVERRIVRPPRAEVGSVEPLDIASLWFVFDCSIV